MNIKQAKQLRYLVCHLAQVLASGNSKGGRRLQGSSHVLPLKMPPGRGGNPIRGGAASGSGDASWHPTLHSCLRGLPQLRYVPP